MKNMVLSNNFFLDYDGFGPQAFDPCVDLPHHIGFLFMKR
jgi:hypothetical protein